MRKINVLSSEIASCFEAHRCFIVVDKLRQHPGGITKMFSQAWFRGTELSYEAARAT